MKSGIPKVMHKVYERPLIQYVLDTVGCLKPDITVVVTGVKNSPMRKAITPSGKITFAAQKQQKGTAHALTTAMARLRGFTGTVLVVNGDTPLLVVDTLKKFLRLHRKNRNSLSLISFDAEDPGAYGRIIRDPEGKPLRIVENLDASSGERAVREVNSGVYAFERPALSLLKEIKLNRKKGEYYLTDVVELAPAKGLSSGVYLLGDEKEFLGVNTREELSRAHEVLRKRTLKKWINRGVSFVDTSSVHIEPAVTIGRDTLIYPNVYLQGSTRIGRACTVYPNVRIVDSAIKDGSEIKDTTLIEESTVGPEASVGPFAHLRPGSRIGRSSKIGNFVEVKASIIGKGTKAMHLTYIGDADIGSNVNIGAGTITCNYDGMKKHRTKIESGVFVGSDTQLVAPVKVGRKAYIGAGTTVTRDVPPGHLAVSRAPQKNLRKKRKRKR
jgi:bifunctional UDP-N-acetylglucosamine pyrophosphorylase/glucosamine-1-phosphate N-acetyltransferase